tara:strand:- start:590 stop:811 length:222 start_codon:yes stop_codon:yes gene_type:complete
VRSFLYGQSKAGLLSRFFFDRLAVHEVRLLLEENRIGTRMALAFLGLERGDRRILMSRKMEESSNTDTELWQV